MTKQRLATAMKRAGPALLGTLITIATVLGVIAATIVGLVMAFGNARR